MLPILIVYLFFSFFEFKFIELRFNYPWKKYLTAESWFKTERLFYPIVHPLPPALRFNPADSNLVNIS